MANFSGIIAKMIRRIMISQGTGFGFDPLANKASGLVGEEGDAFQNREIYVIMSIFLPWRSPNFISPLPIIGSSFSP